MNYIKSLLLFALSALMLLPTSCVQEEPAGSKAIIPDEKDLVLPASAVEQPFTIYADGVRLCGEGGLGNRRKYFFTKV
mgnify:CR=1 FL=1